MELVLDATHRLQSYSSPFVPERVEYSRIEFVDGRIHPIVDTTRVGCFDIRVLKDHIGEEGPAMPAKSAEQLENPLNVIVDPVSEIAFGANPAGQHAKLSGHEREDAER